MGVSRFAFLWAVGLFCMQLALLPTQLEGRAPGGPVKVSLDQSSYLNVALPADGQNSFVASLNLYIPRGLEPELPRLLTDLNRAQTKLNQCGISLHIEKVIFLEARPEFLEYESVEFNGGNLSPHELALFSQIEPFSAGIVLVDSLDWTIGSDGTVAVAYAPYILDLNFFAHQSPETQRFLYERMAGHAILGRHRSQWTLLHELGHALMNLRHETRDTQNIMLPHAFARSPDPNFSQRQCLQGVRNAPWIRPIQDLDGWKRPFQLFKAGLSW